MIGVDEARRAIVGSLAPLAAEEASLEAAFGRTLAAPVVAQMNQPPFAASAMDGYAVRLDEASREGARLRVVGTSSAGEQFSGVLPPGAAVRIFTGAPVPAGADHILIQEQAALQGDVVVVRKAQDDARHIRPEGLDFRRDEILLEAGAELSAPGLALAAAGDVARVLVRRRPRVAVIANGDELRPPGRRRRPDQIVCSIPFGLCPLIDAWGGKGVFLGTAPDDVAAIRDLAERALEFDLIVPIGGASVGARDFMRRAFADLGLAPEFDKVAIKPAKPTWFGAIGNARVLGVPGNPASAFVAAVLFLKPAILALLGRPSPERVECVTARTTRPLEPVGPRETYLRAHLADDGSGGRVATAHENQDSSLLSVLARSDVLIRRPSGGAAAPPGSVVDCLPI